jgi:hypothetical protein
MSSSQYLSLNGATTAALGPVGWANRVAADCGGYDKCFCIMDYKRLESAGRALHNDFAAFYQVQLVYGSAGVKLDAAAAGATES